MNKKLKLNFGVKKEISKVLFESFGEMGIVGCMPSNFAVDFDNSKDRIRLTCSLVLQNSIGGKMETVFGCFDISYKSVENYLEQSCAWGVGCEIWGRFEKLIRRDVKELVEGATYISITDEEMEEKIKKNEEKNEV